MKTQSDIALIIGSKYIYVEPAAINETAKRIAENSTYGTVRAGINSIQVNRTIEQLKTDMSKILNDEKFNTLLPPLTDAGIKRLKEYHNKPTNDIKGEYMGICNLSSCKTGMAATWYNYGSLSYYCPGCAKHLNSDPYNQRDAKRLFGHDLCLEGPKNN